MDNLIFSLNATVPIFLLMVLGLFLRKVHIIDEIFASKMNAFVFKIALPVMLFHDLATVDFKEGWNGKFVLFCFVVTFISIGIAFLISRIWKDKTIQGEYIQASYRSSAAILGIAFIQNIYGNSGMGPMMIIGSVPLYNVAAVLVLSFFSPEARNQGIDGKVMKKTLIGIAKNPIIIGIVIGLVWSLFKLPLFGIPNQLTLSIGRLATPLGLIAMGASFDMKKAMGTAKPAVAAAFTKLVGFCIIFLPLAYHFGFRNEEMIAILVMLGSPTTVGSFVMARNMGHEGSLTANVVMLTTLFSAFTLTVWLFVLKSLGLV